LGPSPVIEIGSVVGELGLEARPGRLAGGIISSRSGEKKKKKARDKIRDKMVAASFFPVHQACDSASNN